MIPVRYNGGVMSVFPERPPFLFKVLFSLAIIRFGYL